MGDLCCLWCCYSSRNEGMVPHPGKPEAREAMGRSHLVSLKGWAAVTGPRERTRFTPKKGCGQDTDLCNCMLCSEGWRHLLRNARLREEAAKDEAAGPGASAGNLVGRAGGPSTGNGSHADVPGLPRWPQRQSACNAGDAGSAPGSGRSLVKGTAAHSSVLAWKIPWKGGLAGHSPCGRKEADMTKWQTFHFFFFFPRCFGQESEMIRLCYEKNQSWLKEFKEWIWWEQDWM